MTDRKAAYRFETLQVHAGQQPVSARDIWHKFARQKAR